MSVQSKVAKNTFYLVGAYVMQKALTFFYFIMIAQAYKPVGQGTYSTALAFTAMFAVFIDLGFAAVLTREVAKDNSKAGSYLGQAIILRIFAGLLMYGVIVISAHMINYGSETVNLIYWAGLGTLLDMLATSCWAIFRAFHNLKYEAINVILETSIMVVLGLIFINFKMPLVYLMYAVVLSSIINFVLPLCLLIFKEKIKIIFKFDKQLFLTLFKLALPFAMASVFSRIYTNIDINMLNKFAGEAYAGYYSAANKIILALQFVPAAISAVILPAMSSCYINNKELLAKIYCKAIYYLMLIVIPAAIGITLLASYVAMIYGPEYTPTALPLQVLTGALIFAFLIFPQGALMAAVNRQTSNTIILAVAAVFNVVGNLLLIPSMKAVGAAIISSLTYALIFIISSIYTRKYWASQSKFLFQTTIKIVAASLLMGIAVYLTIGQLTNLTQNGAIIFAVSALVGVIVYAIAIFSIKGVSIKDVKQLIKAITKKEGIENI